LSRDSGGSDREIPTTPSGGGAPTPTTAIPVGLDLLRTSSFLDRYHGRCDTLTLHDLSLFIVT
jgi:hypothetical protein